MRVAVLVCLLVLVVALVWIGVSSYQKAFKPVSMPVDVDHMNEPVTWDGELKQTYMDSYLRGQMSAHQVFALERDHGINLSVAKTEKEWTILKRLHNETDCTRDYTKESLLYKAQRNISADTGNPPKRVIVCDHTHSRGFNKKLITEQVQDELTK